MKSKTASAFTKSSSPVYLKISKTSRKNEATLIENLNWTYNVNLHFKLALCFKILTYPLFVTMHVIPAAFAAARPIALSSTTTQLQGKKKKDLASFSVD